MTDNLISQFKSTSSFRYESGQLLCDQVPMESIAEQFGTPTYVYSRNAISRNLEKLKKSVGSIPHLICYSVKANSNLRILKLLREAGCGFDIVSGGELARVQRVGAEGNSIVFSGVGKTVEEIDAALKADILMFNVESAGELEVIESRARALGQRTNIAIRVNPDVVAETHPYISTGQIVHKFGVPKEEAVELYQRAAASEHLRPVGVACHIGSQILEVEPFLKALQEILEVADSVSASVRLRWVDLGGGFGISYAGEPPLDLNRLGSGLERIRNMPYCLILEPGRSLVGDAGLLLTRVLYVKRGQHKSFVVVDAGMNDLMRPTLYGSYHEIVPVKQHGSDRLIADVVGPLCETGDFLAQDRELADAQSGELLAILTVGAYGFVLASNYNTRPRPAEVLVNGSEPELIRPRERVEDLISSELG